MRPSSVQKRRKYLRRADLPERAVGNLSRNADGVKKIGPTQYEVRKTGFVPGADLHVLILKRTRGR
jgi:hypothetical protein